MATVREVESTLEVLSGMFPGLQVSRDMIANWSRLLTEIPIPEVHRAIDHYAKTSNSPHAPTVSQVLGAIRDLNPARVPIFRGHITAPGERLASPELLKKQMQDARQKYPHLFEGRPVPEDAKEAISWVMGAVKTKAMR